MGYKVRIYDEDGIDIDNQPVTVCPTISKAHDFANLFIRNGAAGKPLSTPVLYGVIDAAGVQVDTGTIAA